MVHKPRASRIRADKRQPKAIVYTMRHETHDLFGIDRTEERLGPGATILRGRVLDRASDIWADVERIAQAAPFRHMVTPGGFAMSAAMTNCGRAGWVTDRRGYRYAPLDPESGLPWPAMSAPLSELAATLAEEAGFAGFVPDVCLINRYAPGSKLTLHQDRDERDFSAPIVSLSLGLPATFLFGGTNRGDKTRRIPLRHGDAVVWGGPSRLAFHGIAILKDGRHPLTGPHRINLTFRKAL